MDRRRRLLWKRLCKCKLRLKGATFLHQLTKLIQDKSDLEQVLSQDYEAVNKMEEDEAVLRIKQNPKAFCLFAKADRKLEQELVPFLTL